jgi:cob(I)alamin adenosyltransferase
MNIADLLNAETLNDWMNIPRDMQMRQQTDLIETLQAKVTALQNQIYAQAEEALFTASEEMRESEKVREMIQWMEHELDELNYQLSKAQEQLDEERFVTNAAIELINELVEEHGEDAQIIQQRFAAKING